MSRGDLLRSSTRALAAKAAARIEQKLAGESAESEQVAPDAVASRDPFPTVRCANPTCSHSRPVVAEELHGVLLGRARCGSCGASLSWPNTPEPVRFLDHLVVLTPMEDWSGRFYDSYQHQQQREHEGRQRLAAELVARSSLGSGAGERPATPGAGAAVRPLLLERLRDDLAIIRHHRTRSEESRAAAAPTVSDAEVEQRVQEAIARTEAVVTRIQSFDRTRRPLLEPQFSAAQRQSLWRDLRDLLVICVGLLSELADADAERVRAMALAEDLFTLQSDMGATLGTPEQIMRFAARLRAIHDGMPANDSVREVEAVRDQIWRVGHVLCLLAGRSYLAPGRGPKRPASSGTKSAPSLGNVLDRGLSWLNRVTATGTTVVIDGRKYTGFDTDPVIQQAKGFHLVQIGTEWGNPVYRRCYCDGSICGTVPNGQRGRRQEAGDGSDARRSPSPSPIDQLKELGRLHGQGLITDEEFAAKKAEILDR